MDDIMGKLQEMLSDEESMRQIKELADMLSASSDDENTQNPASGGSGIGFDMGMLFKIQELMSSVKTDKNTELITALKPHLSGGKQEKADKALRLMKLFNVLETMKESGMLKDLDKML